MELLLYPKLGRILFLPVALYIFAMHEECELSHEAYSDCVM